MNESRERVVALYEDELDDPGFRHVKAELAAVRRRPAKSMPILSPGEALRALGLADPSAGAEKRVDGVPNEESSGSIRSRYLMRTLEEILSLPIGQRFISDREITDKLGLERDLTEATKWEAICRAFAQGRLIVRPAPRRRGAPLKPFKKDERRAAVVLSLQEKYAQSGENVTRHAIIKEMMECAPKMQRGIDADVDLFRNVSEERLLNSVNDGVRLLERKRGYGRLAGLFGRRAP